jgi:hypothetical protein
MERDRPYFQLSQACTFANHVVGDVYRVEKVNGVQANLLRNVQALSTTGDILYPFLCPFRRVAALPVSWLSPFVLRLGLRVPVFRERLPGLLWCLLKHWMPMPPSVVILSPCDGKRGRNGCILARRGSVPLGRRGKNRLEKPPPFGLAGRTEQTVESLAARKRPPYTLGNAVE